MLKDLLALLKPALGHTIACADEDELALRSTGHGGLLLGWAEAG
jgi:hypothetical protein